MYSRMKMSAKRIKSLLPILIVLAANIATAQAPSDCPRLEIVGPPGLTMPGELAAFSLKPNLPNFDKLQFKWEVSLGAIEDGQETAKVSVRTDTDKLITSITATVTVTGLPQGCANSASETAGVAAIIDHFPIDEYAQLPYNDERGRLDVAIAQIMDRPAFDLLFFLHAPKRSSKASVAARKKRIERHIIGFRKFSATRVHFVRRHSEDISTHIYMLPRDLVETFIWSDDTVLP